LKGKRSNDDACRPRSPFTGEIKQVVMDLSGELTKNHEATLKHKVG